jgi:uncharacterized protein
VSSSWIATVLAALLPTMVVHAPRADITLEIARTDAERAHGLMNRTSVPAHTGMIFVFARDEVVQFWMKDTLAPLDMIFVAGDGTVRRVFANVPVVPATLPDDEIPLEGAQAKYVIELAAGEAARDGIAAGVKLDLHGAPAPI